MLGACGDGPRAGSFDAQPADASRLREGGPGDGAPADGARPDARRPAAGADARVPDGATPPSPDAPRGAPDAGSGPASATPPAEYCMRDELTRYACCVFERVNLFRRAQGPGLPDFAWDPGVADVAAWYAQRMAEAEAVAHGLDGRACGGRLTAFGIDWSSCGENVAGNTVDDAMASCTQIVDEQWANSSGHRRAMLSADWSQAGVGVARAGGWWYVTLNFREP